MRRAVAIELEVAGFDDCGPLSEFARATGAGLASDGSIGSDGVEIVCNPAIGDRHIENTQALVKALESAGVKLTDACGFHVHVDARDYSQFDLRRLMILWVGVERVMFELASRERIKNTYCKPSGALYRSILCSGESSKKWGQVLAEMLYREYDEDTGELIKSPIGKLIPESKKERYQAARYSALNLHSYFFRKTVEFRLHEAGKDKPESLVLQNWPLVCGNVVDYAFRHTEAQLIDLLMSRRKSETILLEVLPEPVAVWVRARLKMRRDARAKFGTLQDTDALLRALGDARKVLQGGSALWMPKKSAGSAVAVESAAVESESNTLAEVV